MNTKQRKWLGFWLPNERRSRLVGHLVQVYGFNFLEWANSGKRAVKPTGELELIVSVDIGKELLVFSGEASMIEDVIEENVEYEVKPGFFVKGNLVKKGRYEYDPNLKIISNGHIVLDFENRQILGTDNFGYSFWIDKAGISIENPKEFHITNYVEMDGIRVSERQEIVRVVYHAPDRYDRPTKFKRFHYSEGKTKIIVS